MVSGIRVVDFHAHLQGIKPLLNLCPENQQTSFFRLVAPVLERVANLSEPVHDQMLRHMSFNFRDALSRHVYGRFAPVGLIETLRLFKKSTIKQLLHSMDTNDIDHAVVLSLEPLTQTADLIEHTKEHRDRVSIFASVHRDNPNPTGYLSTLINSGQVAGLKLHPVVGGYACGELYEHTKSLVALANEARIPIVIHTGHIPVEYLTGLAGCNEVRAVEPLLAAFPQATFVLAHMGWESWRWVLKLAGEYSNVMLETSWQPARIIRRAVDAIGPERVLFGSDYPLFGQALALKQVQKALSPRELVLVTSANACRLLRLPSGHQTNGNRGIQQHASIETQTPSRTAAG